MIAAEPEAIVLSPGPCTPNEAGICLDLIAQGAATHADPRRLPRPSGHRAELSAARWCARRRRCTARSPRSTTTARACFAASTAPSWRRAITRWWSSATACRRELEVTAETDDGVIMGLMHETPAGARRAVPSRKHRLRARPSAAEEFPRSRRRVERVERTAQRQRRMHAPRN